MKSVAPETLFGELAVDGSVCLKEQASEGTLYGMSACREGVTERGGLSRVLYRVVRVAGTAQSAGEWRGHYTEC